VRNTILPFLNQRGELEGFQAFVEDVTESRMLEKQFWQAQKFEAIDRLAGGIAHDFNNVLMVVGSYAELILENEPENEKVASFANHIRGAADRAASITRQLLAFSRRQILELEVLNLNTVLTDLGKMLPKLLGEDVTVTITLDPALRQVKVDRGQMEQVVMNLASNARDAMTNGGRFIVNTRNVEADAAYLTQRSPMLPGPYVVLSITDTGSGMDAETKARIFEPFFTTKERGSGTGLGLASVYGIVKQSGGFIWVASKPGQGTTFDIYLPPVAEPITRAANPNWAGQASKGSETILLVEDEAELRAVACGFLESKGYTVLVAGDSPEALHICKQHTGRINALLTDLVLPGMDGVEMAKAAKTLHPEMRTLYMTGYMDRNVGKLRAGDVLLQKPFKLSFLGSKLREVLAS
jgi:nitrogen-specific signal transduction histidine kinase/CheY-like chemotaxis protein